MKFKWTSKGTSDIFHLTGRKACQMHLYRGGGEYGYFGGYDITLLEMSRTIVGFETVCLPSPSFDDLRHRKHDTMIAGYGRYFRWLLNHSLVSRSNGKTCETNRYGPMKFHYCDKVAAFNILLVFFYLGKWSGS